MTEYQVDVEYRHEWKDGRKIKNPKWKKEKACFRRLKNKGILRGAKQYEGWLGETLGKNNVRNFKITKVKEC